MNRSIIIAQVDRADRRAIADLSLQLGYPSGLQEVGRRISQIIRHPDHCAFTAGYQGKVIGWIHAFYTIRLESEPFVEIAGLVVDHNFRKMGAGTYLIAAVSSWALSRKVKSLRVRSNTIRAEAHLFYERQGFKKLKEQAVFSFDI
jgi:GNAT superfamily N-acetyltransferase